MQWSSIPEPSTWAMMLFGFAGLGWPALAEQKRPARPNALKPSPWRSTAIAVAGERQGPRL